MSEANLQDWYNILLKSLEEFVTLIGAFLPKLIGAFLLYIIGKIIAKVLKKTVIKLFHITKLNVLLAKTKINESLEKIGFTVTFEEFIGSIVYWAVFLIFLMAAAEVVGIEIISTTIASLVNYIPSVIAAIIVVVLTTFVARLMKDLVIKSLGQVNLESYTIIGSATYALILVFGLTIAMNQLGLNVTIITTNITIVLGGIFLAIIITFAYGSHAALTNLIAGYYVRKQFKEKDKIIVANVSGEIKELQKINLVIHNEKGDLIVPYTKILKNGSF